MCRIFGSLGKQTPTYETLLSVANKQLRGGPDAQSFVRGDGWSLGNNRLAIQGLDGGAQPFTSAKISVVYNGEIYNHRELRRDLLRAGYPVEDRCDGAILPALYQRYGKHFIEYLDGMFAIALLDLRSEPRLLLANDPAAIKSVYHFWDEPRRTFYFASELSGLFGFSAPSRRFRAAAVHEFMSLRAVWCPGTAFVGVEAVPPGSVLEVKLGAPPTLKRYSSRIVAKAVSLSFSDNASGLRNLLEQEVERMLPSEVPVCLVTSGGLDSSLLSAIAARKSSRTLDTFHLCIRGDWPADERVFAQEVAAMVGTNHHEIEVDPEELPELLEQVSAAIGQPNTAPHNLSTYALFRGISAAGFKVAITGEGSDEYFGGYQRFTDAAFATAPNWPARYLDTFGPFPHALRDCLYSSEYAAFLRGARRLPEKLHERLSHTVAGEHRLRTLLGIDQRERMPGYILRRADHLSMAHAVEARVPFCQPMMVDFARRLPSSHLLENGRGKRIVYEAAATLLPASVLERKKQPFTLPVEAFLRRGQRLFEYANDILRSQRFSERGIFNADSIIEMLERDRSTADAMALWCVLALEAWIRSQEAEAFGFSWNNE